MYVPYLLRLIYCTWILEEFIVMRYWFLPLLIRFVGYALCQRQMVVSFFRLVTSVLGFLSSLCGVNTSTQQSAVSYVPFPMPDTLLRSRLFTAVHIDIARGSGCSAVAQQ